MKKTSRFFLAVSLVVLAMGQDDLVAQDLSTLRSTCISRMPGDRSLSCHTAIFAARSIQSVVSVADGMGSETVGSSSTIGRRSEEGLSPRNLSLSLSAVGVWSSIPRLGVGGTHQGGINGMGIYGIKASVTAGLFEGLSITPGVSGIFGLDLLGSLSSQFLFWESELPKNQTTVGSLGVRIGILRESFSTPGLTFSIIRQFDSNIEIQSPRVIGLAIGSKSTRFRTTIGKDFGKFNVLTGVGWNKNSGLLQGNIPGMLLRIAHTFSSEVTHESQRIYYAGLSFTDMVFQLSFEFGIAEGLNDPYVRFEAPDFIPFSRFAIRTRF